jgi:hypothetical protein
MAGVEEDTSIALDVKRNSTAVRDCAREFGALSEFKQYSRACEAYRFSAIRDVVKDLTVHE